MFEIKLVILEELGVDPWAQTLVFRGARLRDDETARDVGVGEGPVLSSGSARWSRGCPTRVSMARGSG